MRTAFIDESIRPGWYSMTMVSLPFGALGATRRRVRRLIGPGSRRTHFSAESPARRRSIITAYTANTDLIAHVAATAHGRGNDQPARDRCLAALLEVTSRDRIHRLILDTRHPDRDRLDRRTIAVTLHRLGHDLTYDHIGSRQEELLSLPDAIGWCWGAGGRWREAVRDVADEIQA